MNFKDLQFKKHKAFPLLMSQAKVELPNGNGLSVVNGEYAYCDNDTYEIAPLIDGHLIHIDSWGDQVKGYVTPEQITEVLHHMEDDSPDDYKKFLEDFT